MYIPTCNYTTCVYFSFSLFLDTPPRPIPHSCVGRGTPGVLFHSLVHPSPLKPRSSTLDGDPRKDSVRKRKGGRDEGREREREREEGKEGGGREDRKKEE